MNRTLLSPHFWRFVPVLFGVIQLGFSAENSKKVQVAAIQMNAELGEVDKNLQRAERLVVEAFGKGAQWVILPEFFTSAMGVHQKMLGAARPIDGEPTKLLKRLAKEHNGVVGGSFLAIRNGDTFNTFVLAYPDGSTFFHDKDYPTFWENNYYIGGKDDGVFKTAGDKVGAALCWEFIRSETAKRLLGKVDVVVGSACWWAPPDDVDTDDVKQRRKDNLELIKESPVRFAKIMGVPVVFAQQAGKFQAFADPDETRPYNSHFVGETMIVDGKGNILARRSFEEGEGIVMAEVVLGKVQGPTDPIPEQFWIPNLSGINGGTKDGWEKTLKPGRTYYDAVVKPFRAKTRN
jgi:predicted amidohydrolase